MLPVLPPAILVLADGSRFIGISIGSPGQTCGEVVFNTALTGYQEILTDPSYCRQIVTLTYPHIGSYGVNTEDVESDRVHAAGLIIKDLPVLPSNFRMSETLPQYLQREGTVAIANIDTRRLTRLLRSTGAQNGCILTLEIGTTLTEDHFTQALAAARAAPSMAGLDLAQVVSSTERSVWNETEWAAFRKRLARETAAADATEASICRSQLCCRSFADARSRLAILHSHCVTLRRRALGRCVYMCVGVICWYQRFLLPTYMLSALAYAKASGR